MSPDCQDGLKRYQQDHQAVTRYKRAWPTPHENFIIASYRRNAMARPVIPITVAKMVTGKCWSLLKDSCSGCCSGMLNSLKINSVLMDDKK